MEAGVKGKILELRLHMVKDKARGLRVFSVLQQSNRYLSPSLQKFNRATVKRLANATVDDTTALEIPYH